MLIRVFLLWVILSGSAVWDLRERRVPNLWLAAGFLACMAAVFWEESRGSAGVYGAGAAVICGVGSAFTAVAVTFPLFLFRMMGAGDLKLMGVICGCLGIGAGLEVIACGLAVGAFLALARLMRGGRLRRRVSYFIAYFKRYFLTYEITAYYDPKRDGYGDSIHMALCFWGGMAIWLMTEKGGLQWGA